MVKTLTLLADESALHIDVAENGWAKLTLVGQSEIYLGADGIDVVAARLIGYLANDDVLGRASAGKIDGYSVHCLLLLFEAHHALYVSDPGSEHLLFWQDARTSPVSIVGVMRLSLAQRQQWVEALSQVLEEAQRPSLVAA